MPTVEVIRRFQRMNTEVDAIVCVPHERRAAGAIALQQVEDIFRLAESTISRFRPDSDLSRLNESAGRPFRASPVLFQVVSLSLEMARLTNGLFDPTILKSLIACGYDRSFEKLDSSGDSVSLPSRHSAFTWRDVVLDHEDSTIFLPHGCGIDLGGIGKGWAVDRAHGLLRRFPSFAIDAGGDIRVEGTQANGLPWTVGVSDPFDAGHDLTLLELTTGAVCTSTTLRRRWQVSGSCQHHLIDPRTGKPSASDVVSATVTAASAVLAEVLAKASLILGSEAGTRLIAGQEDVEGLLVLENGRLLTSSALKEYQSVA